MSESESLDDLIDSTGSSLFDWVLKISLFIGAIFQLVCIFAVILLPGRTSENQGDAETEEVIVKHEGTLSESAKPPSLTPDQPSRSTASRANKRHEKKKKR